MEQLNLVAASTIESQPVRWLWPNRIPLGGITILEGDPATNKTTLALDLAARVSAGRELPNCQGAAGAATVLVLTGEDRAEDIRATLAANRADVGRVLLPEKGYRQSLTLPADCDALAAEIARNKARLVILDPITAFLPGSASTDAVARPTMRSLAGIAEETGAAILVLRHLTKNTNTKALYRGGGAIGFVAAARSVLLVAHHPVDPAQRVVCHIKANLCRPAAALAFHPVETHDGRLRVEWLGPVSYTAEQLLANDHQQDEHSPLHEACRVLFSILGEGPLLAKAVIELAAEAGVSGRTLTRAKRLMGVKSKRQGFGPGSRFYWVLPDSSELVEHLRAQDLDHLAEQLSSDDDAHVEDDQDPADWWKAE